MQLAFLAKDKACYVHRAPRCVFQRQGEVQAYEENAIFLPGLSPPDATSGSAFRVSPFSSRASRLFNFLMAKSLAFFAACSRCPSTTAAIFMKRGRGGGLLLRRCQASLLIERTGCKVLSLDQELGSRSRQKVSSEGFL